MVEHVVSDWPDDLHRVLNGTVATTVTTNDDDLLTQNDSSIVRETFRIYGTLYISAFVLYAILRRCYPWLFNVRGWVPELRCDLAQTKYGLISWFWKVFRVKDQDIFEQCGMDALCFIRAMRFGRNLGLMGSFNALWLIPVYMTAKEAPETEYLNDWLTEISVAHLPNRSSRYTGTLLATYITFLFTMYLILQEMHWYTYWRHRFLSQREPRNYAVYVAGIPDEWRSSKDLTAYFHNCTSKDSVLEAHVAMDLPSLEAKHLRRGDVVRKLEHAVALQRRTGTTEKHHTISLSSGIEKVKTVAALEAELERLNREIPVDIQRIKRSSDRDISLPSRAAGVRDLIGSGNADIDWSPIDDQATDHDRPAVVTFIEIENSDPDKPVAIIDEDYCPRKRNLTMVDEYADSDVETSDESETADDTSPKHDNKSVSSTVNGNCVAASTSEDAEYVLQKFSREDGKMFEEHLGMHRALHRQDQISGLSSSDIDIADTTDIDEDIIRSAVGRLVVERSRCCSENESQGDTSSYDGFKRESSNDSSQFQSRSSIRSGAKQRPSSRGRSRSATRNDSERSDRSRSNSRIRNSISAGVEVVNTGTRALGQSLSVAGNSIASGSQAARQSFVASSRAAGGAIKKVAKDVNVDRVIKSAAEGGAQSIIKVGTTIVASASAVVPSLRIKGEGSTRNAGFVVFKNLYTVQSVLQMVHDARPYVMDCFEAPEPGDIFWRNVGLVAKARRVGNLLSVSATVVTCIFWSIPMTVIASLTEVNSLKEELPRLGRFIDRHPKAETVIVQLAPLILLIFNETILPSVLKYFARWEGHISAAMLEASLFVKLGFFMIIQTFFVSAISGGITSELSNILSNPEMIIDLLANSLPAQSTYFVQIILASTFLLQSLELLRVYPLGVALLRRFFGPQLTANERRRTWWWLNSLEDPPDFWHAETFAQIILYFMVFFVYAVIAPFTSFVVLLCFTILESGYRYQLIHNYPRAFDTGGKLWYYFIQFILASMVIAQLTLIGLMALKQSTYASPVLIPLLVVTCLFIIYINSRHSVVARHLPTRNCIEADQHYVLVSEDDEEIGVHLSDFTFVYGKYLQPALQNEQVCPDYEDDEYGDAPNSLDGQQLDDDDLSILGQ